MLRIKLTGHDFRYEVFQIVSLFYNKSDFEFVGDEGKYDIESSYDPAKSKIYCRINRTNEKPVFFEEATDINNKKKFKNTIKLTLLNCLKEYTGMEVPWGILVGIRPTKIVHEGRREGLTEKQLLERLTVDYAVSKEKALLTTEVASKEAPFLECGSREISIYLGIPFCPTRCSYCSFTSNPVKGKENLVQEYLKALAYETQNILEYVNSNGYKVSTVYIGGGTPTSLSAADLYGVLKVLDKHIDLKKLKEFTIEAGRADSIDIDKLRVIKESGCGRISINPQTMNNETLKRIGRMHTAEEVIEKYNLARELGFDNINMDIIIGLPGEGEKEIHTTMEKLIELSPENVTVHTMAIKRASILNEMDYRGRSDLAKTMYDIAVKALRDSHMYPYYMYRQKNMVSPLENISYCRPGKECIYNIQMIAENISILALGADAVSKVVFRDENRIERTANLKDVREYNARVKEMVENKIKLFETKI